MPASLTIIKYPKAFVPFAFFAMAVHRLPLWLNKDLSFYKLMGIGKNGTFDKVPDLCQWAILAVFSDENKIKAADHRRLVKDLYGNFIAAWYRFFRCTLHTYILQAEEGHGTWDGKKAFGVTTGSIESNEQIAVLTRASIKLSKLKYFWANVAPVAAKMNLAKGFIRSYGIGELPWIKQATFSIWENKDAMKAFAYGTKEHATVVKRTRSEKWYSEDMFVRFRIIKELKPTD